MLLQVLITINPPAKQTRPSDTRDNLKRGSREPIWVGIVELKPGMCRYLRDGDGGIEFCGAATQSLSSSWCPAHKLICCATQERETGGRDERRR